MLIVLAVAVVISMLLCYRSLREAHDWSLTDTLSEEEELTKTDPAGNPIDAGGKLLAAGQLPLPDMTKVTNFFYSGPMLLAPYLINTFSSVFSILKPQSSAGVRRLAGCKAHKYPDGIVAFFVLGCGCR